MSRRENESNYSRDRDHQRRKWRRLEKKHEGSLPDYYISIQDAVNAGWRYGRWPSNFVPGKMLTGGVYNNDDEHLPMNANRQWYEADINYTIGRRNKQRIVWSNDGLIFVTYDHYETFYKIVGE